MTEVGRNFPPEPVPLTLPKNMDSVAERSALEESNVNV